MVVAERNKGYIANWRRAYCARRIAKMDDKDPAGPACQKIRAWLDASFLNKYACGGSSWVVLDHDLGSTVEDLAKGGTGERWGILLAMVDWYDDTKTHRAKIAPESLLARRGLSINNEVFLPWFAKLFGPLHLLLPGGAGSVHLDNARVHLHSNDFNPKGKGVKKKDLVEHAAHFFDPVEGAVGIEQYKAELGLKTVKQLRELVTLYDGARVPEIFKIASEEGYYVERTPPYHPEFQPMELVWSQLKTAYRNLGELAKVPAFLQDFTDSLQEENLVKMVEHCDSQARSGMLDQPALWILDNLPGPPDGDNEHGDVGEMH